MVERGSVDFPAVFTLALPVLAGVAYLLVAGAPASYAIVNAGALALGLALVALGVPEISPLARRVLMAALLVLLTLPLLTGPSINDVTRWLPFGPFTLHAGMLVAPALVVLACEEDTLGPLAILIALIVSLLQPDFASAFALTAGAVGIYQVRPDWKLGLVIIVGFFIAVSAALRGELPAVPFVERVLIDAWSFHPAMTLGLALSFGGSLALVLFALSLPREYRYAMGPTLFGFTMAALISHYPTPLIGYGAAPILGLALAIAVARAQRSEP